MTSCWTKIWEWWLIILLLLRLLLTLGRPFFEIYRGRPFETNIGLKIWMKWEKFSLNAKLYSWSLIFDHLNLQKLTFHLPLTGIKKLIPLYLYGIQTLSKIYKNFLENQKKVLNLRPNLVSDFGKGRPRDNNAKWFIFYNCEISYGVYTFRLSNWLDLWLWYDR